MIKAGEWNNVFITPSLFMAPSYAPQGVRDTNMRLATERVSVLLHGCCALGEKPCTFALSFTRKIRIPVMPLASFKHSRTQETRAGSMHTMRIAPKGH